MSSLLMTPQQLQAVIAYGSAERTAQAKADQDILDQAKAERRSRSEKTQSDCGRFCTTHASLCQNLHF